MKAAAPTRVADEAVVDELAAGLDPCAQERIWRAAQEQALLLGDLHELLPELEGRGQGLFGVDVLARQQRGLVTP